MKIFGSLIFCLITLALFLSVAAASRQELPIGLVELYGDISGIRELTIEGSVFNWEGQYGYTFTIAPDRQDARMHVFNNSRAFNDFHMRHFWPHMWHWFGGNFDLSLQLFEYTTLVIEDSEIRYAIDASGQQIPMQEHRTRGGIYAATPMFFLYPLYIPNYESQLFVNVPPSVNWSWSSDNQAGGAVQAGGGVQVDEAYHVPRMSSLHIPNEATIGDYHLFVPNRTGLFGRTSVYAVYIPSGIVPMAQPYGEWPAAVYATALFTIYLERSQDEIIGLLEHGDSTLLLVSRPDGLEITRINPSTEENYTIFAQTDARFHRHYLGDSFLVLHGFSNDDDIVAVFDLQNKGLNLLGIFPIATFSDGDIRIEVRDIILSNGVVYVAYSTSQNPWDHFDLSTRAFISAFDNNGRLIGRAQILSGVEDDAFWVWAAPGISQRYNRMLQFLTLRGPY